MMTLSDVLSARADNARACAQIDCGALGALTLEALPLRELEQLSRSADADRAIFYAACRDLQRTGAELLKAGKVYRPDQVTALVSDAEAAKAADAVRALSGYQGGQDARESAKKRSVSADASADAGDSADAPRPAVSHKGRFLDHRCAIRFPGTLCPPSGALPRNALAASATGGASGVSAKRNSPLWNPKEKALSADLEDGAVDERGGWVRDDTGEAAPSAGADVVVDESGVKEDGQVLRGSELSEVRPEVVQENSEVRQETVQDMGDDGQIRLDTVRQNVTQFNEFRHGFVQNAEMTERVKAEDGQVSREFLTEELTENAKPDKTQVLWSEPAQTPQNVVEMDKTDGSLRNIEPVADNKSAKQKRKKSNRAHESKSEFAEEVHENRSELTSAEVLMLHEITSEFADELHETTSDFRRGEVREMHESESEYRDELHETTSDFRRGEVREMHESESEYRETVHETESEHTEEVHESESERAERVARLLLEGLRRAAWVR